jgi:hypothetical protein
MLHGGTADTAARRATGFSGAAWIRSSSRIQHARHPQSSSSCGWPGTSGDPHGNEIATPHQ